MFDINKIDARIKEINSYTLPQLEEIMLSKKELILLPGQTKLKLIAQIANKNIGETYFWEWFINKYGIPEHGSRGFGAAKKMFAVYYFQDLTNN